MDNDFEVSVTYKNQEIHFPATFIPFGYSYKFEVDVHGITVFFEPDEERSFRAIVDPSMENVQHKINIELVQLIAETLEDLFK
jgi:hypothetical protein